MSEILNRPHLHLSPEAIDPFDARGIVKHLRHAAIFGAPDALTKGETMRFDNDYDPLPLFAHCRRATAPASRSATASASPARS